MSPSSPDLPQEPGIHYKDEFIPCCTVDLKKNLIFSISTFSHSIHLKDTNKCYSVSLGHEEESHESISSPSHQTQQKLPIKQDYKWSDTVGTLETCLKVT